MKLIIFMLGACIGSFVNVVSYSLPRKIDIIKRRSFCDHCHHILSFIDMIPIVSYIWLKGRCRFCHKYIKLRYTIIEAICGLIGVIVYNHYSIVWAILLFIFFMILVVMSLIDIDTMMVYDELLILLVVISVFLIKYYSISFGERLIGIFIISVPLIIFNNVVIESFGGGDIKLYMILGFVFGIEGIISIFIYSIFSATLVSLFFIVVNKIKKDSYIAFVPYISISVLIYVLYGNF